MINVSSYEVNLAKAVDLLSDATESLRSFYLPVCYLYKRKD